MLDHRGLIAAASGVIALVCGVLAISAGSSQGELGLAARVAGMMAGVFGMWSAMAGQEHSLNDAKAEAALAKARDQVSATEATLADERRGRAEAEASVTKLSAELAEAGTSLAASADEATVSIVSDDATDDSPATPMVVGENVAPADHPGGTLTDVETGLFSEAYFRVALDARIASARRHLRPVAVALLQVVEGVGSSMVTATDPAGVSSVVRETLRDADTASRLDDGSFALILEDTPENGAVWTVERIRRALATRHPQSTLWAGVACYPAHAFSTEELLEQGQVALIAAKEWSQDRIEVATAE